MEFDCRVLVEEGTDSSTNCSGARTVWVVERFGKVNGVSGGGLGIPTPGSFYFPSLCLSTALYSTPGSFPSLSR